MYLMSESLLVTAKIPGHCGKNTRTLWQKSMFKFIIGMIMTVKTVLSVDQLISLVNR